MIERTYEEKQRIKEILKQMENKRMNENFRQFE